jgi:hypothetical protein
MITSTHAVFVGKDRSRVFRDFIAEKNFFFVFESEEFSKTDGHAFMKGVHAMRKRKKSFADLADFETWVEETMAAEESPAECSYAIGALQNGILYVKTAGDGEIHMRRGKDFVLLIHGDKSASGRIKEKDMAVFTTATFRSLIETEEKLKHTLDNDPEDKIVEKLEEYYDEKEDKASMGMFVGFAEGPDAEEDADLPFGFADDEADAHPSKAHAKAHPAAADDEDGEGQPDHSSRDDSDDDDAAHTPNYHARAVMSTEIEDDEPPARRTAFGPTVGAGTATGGAVVSAAAGAAAGSPIPGAVPVAGGSVPVVGETSPLQGSTPDSRVSRRNEDDAPERKSGGFMSGMKDRFASMGGMPGMNRADGKNISKIVTAIAVVLIFVIFIWSVVFGYQRRQAAERQKKIQATEQTVTNKMTQAEEVAFLNMDRALALITESKDEVSALERDLAGKNPGDVSRIRGIIAETENTIVGKEEQEPEEFYDLALEDEDAKGDALYLEGDKIAILDKGKSTVYNFSADKKSIEKSTNKEVAGATIVGMVKGAIHFFVPGKGLYRFDDDEKATNVIENDDEWGEIKGIAFYAANIYMLDADGGDVHKYTGIADGYADKTSYFSGGAPTLDGANSIRIDASVYVGTTDGVLKFTRGEADDFKTTFPTKNVAIERIYTDEDTEKVFAWDKKNATMYILSKTGSYERQIKASVLAKATDFTVYKDQILVLSGSKIYTLSDDAAVSPDDEASDTDE